MNDNGKLLIMIKKSALLLTALVCLPELLFAQLYQGFQNSTATVVRDPARQSSTEIDAVINNPAGTAFLKEGWSLSLSAKLGTQATDFHHHVNGSTTASTIDVIPSIQAAYKAGDLTFSLSLANEGGYGQWLKSKELDFSHALTNAVNATNIFDGLDGIAESINPYDHYDNSVFVDGFLYNYSSRIGVAWKINPHLSIFGGIRLNYITEKTNLSCIQRIFKTKGGTDTPSRYFTIAKKDIQTTADDIQNAADKLGLNTQEFKSAVQAVTSLMDDMANTPDEVNMSESSEGWGLAPVLGLDYSIDKFNFAIRYEPETKIHASNGNRNFHLPGVVSGGASWKIREDLKVAVGGSWGYQKQDSHYGSEQTFHSTDRRLTLNTDNEIQMGGIIDFSSIGHNCYDGSVSLTYSPLKYMAVSFGYTYVDQLTSFKSVFSRSMSERNRMNFISAGLRLNVNQNVQLDLGVSRGYSLTNNMSQYWYTNNYQQTTFSAGVNVSL